MADRLQNRAPAGAPDSPEVEAAPVVDSTEKQADEAKAFQEAAQKKAAEEAAHVEAVNEQKAIDEAQVADDGEPKTHIIKLDPEYRVRNADNELAAPENPRIAFPGSFDVEGADEAGYIELTEQGVPITAAQANNVAGGAGALVEVAD